MQKKKKLIIIISIIVASVIIIASLVTGITIAIVKGKHKHTFSDEWASDETYHWHAATCKHKDNVSDMAEHEWDNGVVITPATTELEGEIQYSCEICHRTKIEPIEKLVDEHQHDFSLRNVTNKYLKSAATCTNPTVYYYSCACGESGETTFEYGEKLGHNFQNYIPDGNASCEEDGTKTAKCERCGQLSTIPDIGSKTGHQFSEQFDSDDDFHWHNATCGHSVTTEKQAHSFDDGVAIQEATETEEGQKKYTCEICQKEVIMSTGLKNHEHSYEEKWSYNEKYHYHAANCTHSLETKDKNEHEWNGGVQVKAATAYEEGETLYTCNVCQATKKEAIPKLDSYLVQFYDYDGSIISEQRVVVGGDAEDPEIPYREGYRFDRWSGSYQSVQQDLKLIANYVKIWEVTFLNYDGTTFELQIIDDGADAVMPAGIPKRMNYRFSNWDIAFTSVHENLTVRPVFIRQYGVTFIDWNGNVLKERQWVDEHGDAVLPESEPQREGYNFVGWRNPNKDDLENSHKDIIADVEIVAEYELKTYTVTFKYYKDGKIYTGTQNVRHGYGAKAPTDYDEVRYDLTDAVGYRFSNWDRSFSEILSDGVVINAEYNTKIEEPIIIVDTQTYTKNNSMIDVTIQIRVIACEPIHGLNLDLSWLNENIEIGSDNFYLVSDNGSIDIGTSFGGNSSDENSLKVDNALSQLKFSWATLNSNSLKENVVYRVLTLKFRVDLAVLKPGKYDVKIMEDTTYYVGEEGSTYVKKKPVIVNGGIIVAEEEEDR